MCLQPSICESDLTLSCFLCESGFARLGVCCVMLQLGVWLRDASSRVTLVGVISRTRCGTLWNVVGGIKIGIRGPQNFTTPVRGLSIIHVQNILDVIYGTSTSQLNCIARGCVVLLATASLRKIFVALMMSFDRKCCRILYSTNPVSQKNRHPHFPVPPRHES